jgi:hypothetical protein
MNIFLEACFQNSNKSLIVVYGKDKIDFGV